MPSASASESPTITPEILAQKRYPLAEAADIAGVDLTTAWRWVLNGVRGVKLKAIRIGNRRHVLESDLLDFLNALNRQPNTDTASRRKSKPSRRRRAA